MELSSPADTPTLTGAQLRGARALLDLSIAELAGLTGLGLNTIRRAEATNGAVPITAANSRAIVRALEEAGVVFIPAGDLGPGIRLRAVTA